MARDDVSVLPLAQPEPFARSAPDDWIAGDLVLDFPSMRPLTERMVRPFVAADHAPACLAAQVRLSPRDAARGRRVPIDLLVRRTCHRCGGRGEQWGEPCACCTGSGEVMVRHQVLVHVPSGVRHGTRCGFRVTMAHGPSTLVDLHVSIDANA